MRLAEFPLFRWHHGAVSVPRAARIARAIVDLAPRPTRAMLDVGCGDGTLAAHVARDLGVQDVRGIDIKVQPNCRIAVFPYDGLTMPFPDATFDLVTISDVLHHATDPLAVMREALRVVKKSGAVMVKDHFRLGRWSNGVLFAMDIIGNCAQGIAVTGNYLSPPEWVDLFAKAGGTADKLLWPFDVHSLPFRLITRSEYQFVARVIPRQVS
jgi:2-polyprenyl-3-methyl-5-hydroxy-6-metoxy-1,4-benzoquinol methylase